jgi:perosamine synthetase
VQRFETAFAARVGCRHGVAVCNGTAALDAAIEALGIGPGDEVIVPAFTIISCIGQIVRAGATPVLVDSDPVTWNMDVRQVEARITPRTRAIMAVHIYGLPVDMDPLLAVAARRGLVVIEDAAQMHGQTYKGRPCGSFGTVATFSFYSNKHVTTGEGGMIVSNDDALAEDCRSLRNLCFQPQKRFVHERLGWNLRMTNLQAAVGLAQLERRAEFLARKRRMGARYDAAFAGLAGIRRPLADAGYARNVYWVYGLVLDEACDMDAEDAMRRLAARGVGTRPFFCPMHWQPVLRRRGLFAGESYPVAERLYTHGFYIPSGLGLTDAEQDQVCEAVREVLQ